ncbi:MAG: hypothetical protein Q8O79_00950 [Pseudomonadota bacterium]|nr:hypothetical protein [Pseudomonadota bacterium]
MTEITLTEIRAAAERLAQAHHASTASAALLQEEVRAAIQPIYTRHQAQLDHTAEEEAHAYAVLAAMVAGAPHLFSKPRSLVIDGVRCGYRKEADTLDWDDDAALIDRLIVLNPEQADLCIRTQASLVIDAIEQLGAIDHRRLGIRRIAGADQPFITLGDSDVDKMVKAILSDAQRRQGEDETPKKKKGKAKAKEPA